MTTHSHQNKILVTGGAGFIGSHLVEKLLNEGKQVICLDNFNDFYNPELKEENIEQAQKHDNCKLIKGDILDEQLLQEIFEEHDINKIVHLAALAGVRKSLASPQDYIDTDIKGTVNLLKKANQHNVEQFVFASSSSVYGESQDVPFQEDQATENQVSPYACSKKAAELFCKTYHNLYNLPVTILRFFTVYGPRQRPEMAIRKFTRKALAGEPIPKFGDGSSRRDYTYIDDVVHGLHQAVEKSFDFEIFNLGNSETITLNELIDLIEEKTGQDIEIDQKPEQPGDVPVTYADISKAKEMLGYNPQTFIEEGLEKFIDWYKENYV